MVCNYHNFLCVWQPACCACPCLTVMGEVPCTLCWRCGRAVLNTYLRLDYVRSLERPTISIVSVLLRVYYYAVINY